jgi:hypothetical protein
MNSTMVLRSQLFLSGAAWSGALKWAGPGIGAPGRTARRKMRQRRDCVAGHEGLELRNVVANYAFESSRGFAHSEPNSRHGDHSRLSCGAADTQLGLGPARMLTRPSCGVAEKAGLAGSLFVKNLATPSLSLRWTCRAKRACVVITDAEPDRLAPLTPPAPMGLRGVSVVAARCCADALERSFACPSANLRAPSRRGLHPRSVRRRPAAISPRGERIRSRRGCWHCCADRAAPPSLPSRAIRSLPPSAKWFEWVGRCGSAIRRGQEDPCGRSRG